MAYNHRCDGCGRGTNNLDGTCDWCKEQEDRYFGPDEFWDDDVSAMERRYEREVDQWG